MMDYRTAIILGAAAFVFMGALSCAENEAIRFRYDAERLYHQAERASQDASLYPEGADDEARLALADGFEETFEVCLDALARVDSETYPVERRELGYLAFQAANRFSQIHFAAHSFTPCVHTLNRLISEVELSLEQEVTAAVNLGQALQASGHWDSAMATYDAALDMQYPPVDDSGEVVFTLFNLPLRTYSVVHSVKDSAAMTARFRMAEDYYLGLADDYSQSDIGAAARLRLANLYDIVGDWEKTLVQLDAMADSGSENFLDVQMRRADVYAEQIRDYERGLRLYREIIDRLKDSEDPLLPLARFKSAMVLMDMKQYDQAREILVDLKRNQAVFYSRTPMAQYTMARSFELQNKWNRAEIEYKLLVHEYPGSDEALSTYLYLADMLEQKERVDEAERWRRDAEEQYDRLIVRGAGSLGEARAMVYKADLRYRQGDYLGSVEVLTTLAARFPTVEFGRKAALRAAVVCRDKLNDPAKADSIISALRTSLVRVDDLN